MNGKLTHITLAILLFCCAACNKETAPDCIKKAGDYATVVRTLDEFKTIEIKDYIFLKLVQSDTFKVEINAPINLIPKIETSVRDETLYIENDNTCNFVRSFKKRITLTVYAPHFYNIQNHGTGDIESIGTIQDNYFKIENRHASGDIKIQFEGDSLAAYIQTGVSSIQLSGSVLKAELFNQGLGQIDAHQLDAVQAYINNSSINDIYAACTSYAFVKIVYSGNIFLKGAPPLIDSDIQGSGKLILTP